MKDGEGAGQDVGQEEVTEGRESDSDAEVLCVDRKRAVAGGVGMMAQRRWVTLWALQWPEQRSGNPEQWGLGK